tara:strand:+ start:38 stop:1903 length:1866 start_codon:yes stop_codon:yes gene_type:complete
MARQSPWQEFANNFNAVYGTFTKLGKNLEAKKLMDEDMEFYAPEDTEKANPLVGLDKDRARMRALADIYTKYGDAEGGLKIRSDLAATEQAERNAEIQRQTMNELIAKVGIGNQLAMAQTRATDASATLSAARASEITSLLGPKLEQAKALAERMGYEATIEGVNAYLAKNTKSEALKDKITELNKNIALNEGIIKAAGDESYERGLIAQQKQLSTNLETAQEGLKQDKITTENLDEKQKADIEATKTDTELKKEDLKVKKGVSESTIAASIAANRKIIRETETYMSLADLDEKQREAELEKRIAEARAGLSGANALLSQNKLKEIESAAFLLFAENADKYKNDDERSAAFINIVNKFDPIRGAKLKNDYTAAEVAGIANEGLKIQNEIASYLQKQDFKGLATYFDDKNGDDFGITFNEDSETGAVSIVETGSNGETVRTLVDAPNRETALENIQAITTFGNAGGLAELLFKRKKGQLELDKVAAEIDGIEAGTTYQEILNDVTKYSKILEQGNIKARTALAEAQTEKLKQEIQKDSGLTFSREIAEKAYGAWLGSSTFANASEMMSGDKDKLGRDMLTVYKNQVKQGLGLLEFAPEGVSNDDWLGMTEDQQARYKALGNQ